MGYSFYTAKASFTGIGGIRAPRLLGRVVPSLITVPTLLRVSVWLSICLNP